MNRMRKGVVLLVVSLGSMVGAVGAAAPQAQAASSPTSGTTTTSIITTKAPLPQSCGSVWM